MNGQRNLDEKKIALNQAIAQIEKQFGRGAIMKMGEKPPMDIQCISTGALSLDLALGGGIPKGRVTEVFGQESSGKTTLCLHLIANVQKNGGIATFIDAEHALDVAYAQRIGVDVEGLLLSQPDSGEQALEIAEHLVRSSAVDIIVIDSVAALVPRAELEGEMGEYQPGIQARLMSQALRRLSGTISKSQTSVIFTNQIREKIGVMWGANPETTPGGRALKFFASVRVEMRRKEQLKEGDNVIGMRAKVTVVKNKIAPAFKRSEIDILYNHGISREGDLLDMGVTKGIVLKSGAWFNWGEIRLGQGREKTVEYLRVNKEVLTKLEKELRQSFGLQSVVGISDETIETKKMRAPGEGKKS
jgi:recombination protein RecA